MIEVALHAVLKNRRTIRVVSLSGSRARADGPAQNVLLRALFASTRKVRRIHHDCSLLLEDLRHFRNQRWGGTPLQSSWDSDARTFQTVRFQEFGVVPLRGRHATTS